MDLRKIGNFLKMLRKEKGMTQEQAAEVFGVSGRTVSRWETGTNMPDLSILVQLAEYYDVEIKEILNGERRNGNMENELKDTLLKVADYSEMEKEKAQKACRVAFMLMFGIGTLAIVMQMMLAADIRLVLGETAAVLCGGLAYILVLVRNGLWESASKAKNTIFRDAVLSVLCAGIFSVIYAFCGLRLGASPTQAVFMAAVFFTGITVVCFLVLRMLAYMSKKQRVKERTGKV